MYDILNPVVNILKISYINTYLWQLMDNSALVVNIGFASLFMLTLASIFFLLGQYFRVQTTKAEILNQSEERLSSLVQNASDIIAILTANGVVDYVSLSITRILGYQTEDFVGKQTLEFVHPDDLITAQQLLNNALQKPATNINTELRLKHFSGDWQDFEVVVNNLLNEPSIAGIVITYRNITKLKQSALALKKRLHQQANVANLGQQALTGIELNILMDNAVRIIAETLEVDYGEILELSPDGKELYLHSGVGWSPEAPGKLKIAVEPNFLLGYTLLSKESLIVNNLADETRFVSDAFLYEHQLISSMTVVIMGNSRPYGVLAVHTTQQRNFNSEDIYFLQAIATILSTAIERKQNEMLLQRYRLLSEHTHDIILFSNINGEIIEANNAALQAYGYTSPEFLSLKIKDLAGKKKNQKNVLIPSQLQQADSIGLVYETFHRRADGSIFPVEISSRGINLGTQRVILNIIRDITERKRFEQALFREKEMAQVTLQSIGDAVITTDAFGRCKSLNPVAEKLTGWYQAEAKGLPLKEVFRIVNEVTQEPIENPVSKLLRGNRDESFANNTVLVARNNNKFAISHSAAPIRSSDGEIMGVVLVFRDVTESRQMARQLSWQASHDALTGLVNRREFEQRLEQALLSANQQKQQHALCFLDLDKFKIINDTCGHAAGDELLCQVTKIIQEQVRKSDTVARLGGDEFAVLLLQCSLEQAQIIAEAIRQQIKDFQFFFQGRTFTIGVSIGLVQIQEDIPNIDRIMSLADAACYQAKNSGRNQVCLSVIDQ